MDARINYTMTYNSENHRNKVKNHPSRILSEKNLRSSDLIEFAGMTYRQINDWQSKGLISDYRTNNKKWRMFTAEEVFVMMVCKEFRDKFGVSLESLNLIITYLQNNETDAIKYVLDLCIYGYEVFLLTDLKELITVQSDIWIGKFITTGLLRDYDANNIMLLRLNPIINKMLEMNNLPQLSTDEDLYHSIYNNMAELVSLSKITEDEKEVLDIIRNKSYKKVTIHLNDGNAFQVDTEEELTDEFKLLNDQQLMEILESNEFQSITIQKQNNKIVRFNRKIPRKMGKDK